MTKDEENQNQNEVTVYECSSCNISFSDVEDHLSKYHGETNEDKEATEDTPVEEVAGDDEEAPGDPSEEIEGMAFVVKNSDGKFECQECQKTFKSIRRFIDHVKTHGSVAEENILKLEEYLQQLNNDESEIVYEQNNENPQAIKYRCKICNTIFDTRKKVLLHYPIHKNVAAAVKKGIDSFGETSKDSLHCKLCNRSLRNSSELAMHMNAHAENQAQDFKKSPQTSSNAGKKKKKGECSYPCQYCQKEFKRPHEKVKHERVHTGEKPYSCDVSFLHLSGCYNVQYFKYLQICGKQFRVTYCLSLHKKNVHSDERPFVCSFEGCSKT